MIYLTKFKKKNNSFKNMKLSIKKKELYIYRSIALLILKIIYNMNKTLLNIKNKQIPRIKINQKIQNFNNNKKKMKERIMIKLLQECTHLT